MRQKILRIFTESQFGNKLQASKGEVAESAFRSYFEAQQSVKNCIITKATEHEDKVLHIDYYITNKRMEHLKDIFPIAERKTDFKNLSPAQLQALGPEKLSKMTMDDLQGLSDEQKMAIFDVLPPEYQELLTTENLQASAQQRVSVEVKGIKNDIPGYIPIEILTVPDGRGVTHPGWIFGKAQLVAFAIGTSSTSEEISHFLMIDRQLLANTIKPLIDGGKTVEVFNKNQAKTSLKGDKVAVYVRISEGQERGKVIYLPTFEISQYKKGNGIIKITK